MERIISIELFGEHYKFKADADDRNAQKVADYLKSKVDDVGADESVAPEVGKFAQLLLATLNICDEYFELKNSYDQLSGAVRDRSKKIVQNIDKNLK